MILKKNFTYLIEPNKSKKVFLFQFAGAKRWIFNWGLQQRKESWEKDKTKITLYEQNNELVNLKTREDLLWLKSIHSQVLQQALHDLDRAFVNFFVGLKKRNKSGYPRFKCKGVRDSFRYPQGVRVEGNRVWLPKVGWVKFRKSREIEGKIKQTTVLREGEKWYVSFSCEIEKEIPKIVPDRKKAVGIDLGILSFAKMAVGEKNHAVTVENPKFLKAKLSKLRFLSRSFSGKKKGGQNRLKARKKLSLLHFKVKNVRSDFFYKNALEIVKNHDIIGVEKMNIKAMLQGSTNLARAISDAGWGMFLNCLKNKALEYGKILYEVSSLIGCTQHCSNCDKKNKIDLSQREYICSCGLKIDRDLNSAINIKNKAVGASV